MSKTSITKGSLTSLVKKHSITESNENQVMLESLKKLWNPKIVNEVTYKVSGKDPNKVANLAKTTQPEDTIEVTDEVVDKTKGKIKGISKCGVAKSNKGKFKNCKDESKFQKKMDEDLKKLETHMKRIIMDNVENPRMKKGSFVQFVSKLK
jgi:hypothetical protein